ncbi:MAG: hypothetical protein Tsb008_08310 [Rhodothalassiaceae bacterium]
MLNGEGPLGPIEKHLGERRLVMSSRILMHGEAMQADGPFAPVLGAIAIWEALRGADAVPWRRDLRPERFGTYLPKMSILDVDLVKRDFRWTLHGGEHEYWMGGSLKGRRASEIPGRAAAVLREQTVSLAEGREPGFIEIRYDLDGTLFLSAHVIALPFAREDAGACTLLCPTNFIAHGHRDML